MDIHAFDNFGFWSLIMEMVFDSICHVIGYWAVFKNYITSCGVNVNSITSVVCNVGMTDGDNTIWLGYVDAWKIEKKVMI